MRYILWECLLFLVVDVDCPGELLFRECITCCPVHCKIEHMCIDSKLQCLDGCYCPDGSNTKLTKHKLYICVRLWMFEDNKIILLSLDLIYEDGVCVKASDCPCEHHGMLYPSGHVIQEDCNNWSDTILSYALHAWMHEEILMLVCVVLNVQYGSIFVPALLFSAHVLGAYGTAQITTAQVFICFYFYSLFSYLLYHHCMFIFTFHSFTSF